MNLLTIPSILFFYLAMQFQKEDISTKNYIASRNAGPFHATLDRSLPLPKSR
jgi:hypothetical protein